MSCGYSTASSNCTRRVNSLADKTRIYTAGKMSGTSFKSQMQWRIELEEGIRWRTDKAVSFIHPPMYYNYEGISQKTEAEIKEWELNKLCQCQVMVVNLDGVNTSTGTHIELGVANAMNMFGSGHIFIIGIGDPDGLHPWIRDSLFRHEANIESACKYIVNYLLD